MTKPGLILFAVLLSFTMAALPPAYGCLFESAYRNGQLSEELYTAQSQARWFLERPGRLLLSPTRFDGALRVTHGPPFGASWVALVSANWIAWLFLLLGAGRLAGKLRAKKWLFSRRSSRERRKSGF